MNAEERRPSLADEAANWVPPWTRGQPGPQAAPDVELVAETALAAEPVTAELAARAEAEAAPEGGGGRIADEAEGRRTPDHPEGRRTPDQPEPPAEPAPVDPSELRGALEAILLVLDEPTGEVVLAQVLEQPTELVAAALAELAAEYAHSGRGFELRRAAGGWRLYTRPEFASYVERFVLDGQQARLTQAALETLAVVAYKQPVTRSRISAIRGVNCDGVIRTLVSRGLVEECGSEPETAAFLYRTTSLFLEKLGLDSLDELPPLAPFLPDDVDEITDVRRR